jgi:hypothetical protein
MPELVTSDAFVAAPESCAPPCPDAWVAPFDSAVVVDITDDGALDIVGLHDDAVEVHLLDSDDGAIAFKTQQLSLEGGQGDDAVAGDFNRDTIDDVGFLVRKPGTAADVDVAVLFGGALENWRIDRFGPFVGVQTLTVEADATLVARTVDSQFRPGGAFIRPGEARHDFGFLVRQPVLARTTNGVVGASVVLRPNDGEERLAHFGFAAGTLSPHDVIVPSSTNLPGMTAGLGVHARAVAVELDATQDTDEIVVLGTTAGGGTAWVLRLSQASQWELNSTFAYGPGFAASPAARGEPAPPGGGPGSAVAVGDVDGDGDTDVVATTDELLPRVMVLRNDGGVLSADPIFLFSQNHVSFEFAHVEPWHVDAKSGAMRWLVGGNDGIRLADIDLSAGHILVRDDIPTARPRALASADVDGDGLFDLIVGTRNDIRIHLAEEIIGAP